MKATDKVPKLNVARLKPGDKLEVQIGFDWQTAEFVERIDDQMVRIKRPSVPFATPMPIAFVRLPAKVETAATKEANENPFATEEERIAARKPRTWTDRDGKFKVEAKLLRVSGDEAVIQREDGKEIAVPLDRLSDADREYVSAIVAPPGERSAVDPNSTSSDDQPELPEVALTKSPLGAADVVELKGNDWTYAPDPAPTAAPLRNVRIVLGKPDTFEHLERILLVPVENKAFVVTRWSFRAQKFNVMALDLQRGTIAGTGMFSTQASPISISPDGKWILARSESFGSGKTAELRLYKRDGLKATPEKAWIPYLHHGPLEDGVHGPNYPRNAEVVWADFIGSDRVMSLSHAGELAVWSVADLKAIYQVKLREGSYAALSPGRKYVAIASSKSLELLQTADGKLAGRLPIEMQLSYIQMDFSPDGRKLAVLTRMSHLQIFDLTTQQLERDFAVTFGGRIPDPLERDLAWVSDNYLLYGNQVIDAVHCRMVWNYTRLTNFNAPWTEYNGRVWFTTRDVGGALTLTSGSVPPEEVHKKWDHISPEDSLAVHPGVEISVDLQVNDPHAAKVQAKLKDSLAARGLKIVDDSPIKLVGTIGPGEMVTTNYRTGRFGSVTTPVTVQGNVATLRYKLGDTTLWKYVTRTGAAPIVHIEEGESIAQAAQSQAVLDSTVFERIWIPVMVANPDSDSDDAKSEYP